MIKPNRKSKDDYRLYIQKFFEKQIKFKNVQAQYNELKAQFNSDMEDFFKLEGIDKSMEFSCNEPIGDILVVNRIQKSNVEFNPDKLEKKLGKGISKQIIVKKYEVIDMEALIAYLKECNVDPNIFRSFLNITKTIDMKELDRLGDLGKITEEQLKGCYIVKKQKPYFTITMK